MNKKVVIGLWLLLVASILRAESFYFEKIPFPVDYEMKVTAIEQDGDGFMWIGTREGLYRYDGFEMERIYPVTDDSVSWRKHQVISLLVRDGQIWFSLHNGDVMNYQVQSGVFSRVYPQEGKTKYLYGRAISLGIDNESNLWVGLTKGLLRIDREKKLTSIGDFRKVFSIWTDNENNEAWVLHDDRIISVINKSDSIIREHKFELQKAVRQFRSGCIQRDQAGVIWASVGNNVYQYLPDLNSFKKVTAVQNEIIDFAFGHNNRLWLNDAFKDLAYYDQNIGKLEHIKAAPEQTGSLGSNNIFSLHMNRSGVLFIGTLGGLYKLDWTKQFFYHLQVDGGVDYDLFSQGAKLGLVLNNFFYWIEQDDACARLKKARIAGDIQSGLKKTVDVEICLPKDVSILERANDKALWAVSSSEGLLWIDLKNNKVYPVVIKGEENLQINGLSNGRNNEIWLTSNKGIFLIRYNKYPYVLESAEKIDFEDDKRLKGSSYTVVHYDKEGKLWFNAKGYGVFRYNPLNNQVQKIDFSNTGADKTAFTRLTCIKETQGGRIWLGSSDSGVAYYDKVKNEFIKVSSIDGLLEDEVCAIVFENENVTWISHIKGITRIELPELKLEHFTHENGLIGGQFIQNAGLKSENGIIFFANTQGWVYFNPSVMMMNQVAPETVVKKYKINGVEESQSLQRLGAKKYALEVPANYKKLDLYVWPMSYASEHQNMIAWRIGTGEWKTTAIAMPWVSVPQLKSGSYQLEFKGANNDGVWSEQPTILLLEVKASQLSKALKMLFPMLIIVVLVLGYLISGRVIVKKRKRKVSESKLSLVDKQRIEELKTLMEEKQVYLNPELSLKDLAGQLHCSTNTLSSVFNDLLNQNFYDYVNNYRVEHVKLLLNNKDMANYTLLSIGFDAGFNSKSSFYRIFKKHTGLTPSEYQKRMNNKE